MQWFWFQLELACHSFSLIKQKSKPKPPQNHYGTEKYLQTPTDQGSGMAKWNTAK